MKDSSNIVIDDELILDSNSYVVGFKSDNKRVSNSSFSTDELNDIMDRVALSIEDLEKSLDINSTSRLSQPGRNGIYLKEGLITNIIIGIIFTLILIILLL